MTVSSASASPAQLSPRWARGILLVVPSLWLGLILGISGIEAPLKFTAPGITIPLGLGIGRRVFLAMNMVELVLGILMLVALIALWRHHRTVTTDDSQSLVSVPRFSRLRLYTLIALGILLIKTVIIRPLLTVHTDAVLSGVSSGGSSTHYYYIAADLILAVILAALVLTTVRAVLPPTRAETHPQA